MNGNNDTVPRSADDGGVPELSVHPNERVPVVVRYEDEDVLVVDKPARIATQPGKGHARDTLLNGLFARYGNLLQNLGAARDWGLLHRLDKDTSGLVLVGLRPRAYDALRAAFGTRRVSKRYIAIVEGEPSKPIGIIRLPIEEVTGEMKTARIAASGKPAVTAYRALDVSKGHALVECRPQTGRLHQIRVHMRAIGCPVLGDTLYGSGAARDRTPRLALHAFMLAFHHPTTGALVEVVSPLPDDFVGAARRLGLRPGTIEPGRGGGRTEGSAPPEEGPGPKKSAES